MKLAVVIPTYNEKDSLPSLIEKLVDIIRNITQESLIIIVDDASPDKTGQIADELSSKHSMMKIIHRDSKMGLGSAYKEGFRHALEKFRADFIIEMDADHSHDPEEIPDMVSSVNNYDFVIASRHVRGSEIIGWDTYRKMVHSTACFLASVSAGIKIADPTSGFRGFKRVALESINFSEIRSDGFAFQIEVLYHLIKKGFRGLEVPTRFVNREMGKSKMGIKETVQFAKACLYLLMKRFR